MSAGLDCWVISDGAAGNERQAQALARALALPARTLRIEVRQPWAIFAPRLALAARHAIRLADGSTLQPPWPRLAIGCGRRAALLTRLLRDWSDGATHSVQILDPRIDSHHFDTVITPQHDALDGDNVIRTIGSLNPVDDAWLAEGRALHGQLAALPGPRTGVLIGASTRAQRIDETYCRGLLEYCRALHASDGGSFIVSISRRTPASLTASLRAAYASLPGIFWAGGADVDNPYSGILGWSDRLIVTPDSVNMISEACATGRPVWTHAPQPIVGKLARFHAELNAAGYLRELGDVQASRTSLPLRETAAVAELVASRWRGAAV